MQRTHLNTTNAVMKRKTSVLAPKLDLNDNIGGLFRLADAMGVVSLFFGNKIDKGNRKLKKAARSTQNQIKSIDGVDPQKIIESFLETGKRVIAIEITEDSKNINNFELKSAEEEVLVVIGNESKGIDAELLESIPEKFHIEMYGENSSMNVISATSMALFKIQNS